MRLAASVRKVMPVGRASRVGRADVEGEQKGDSWEDLDVVEAITSRHSRRASLKGFGATAEVF